MLQALGKLAASAQRSLRLKAVSIISSRANNCNCRRVGRRISPSIREFCRVKPAAFGRIFSSNSQLPLRMIGVTPLGPSHLIMVSRTRRRPCNFGVLCSPVAACAGCTVQHCGRGCRVSRYRTQQSAIAFTHAALAIGASANVHEVMVVCVGRGGGGRSPGRLRYSPHSHCNARRPRLAVCPPPRHPRYLTARNNAWAPRPTSPRLARG